MSDMTTCLNDLSYIPPNNEQNEPTQGDIGETSNEPTQAIRNEFEELYVSVNEELYPNCDYVTRLDFIAKFTYFKVKDSNTLGKKVPKKVLHYFPIIPRLQRLYKSSHTAKEMTWHATGKCTEPGLAADGFNPFDNLCQYYNMWPVILTTYNLPPWLCMKESSFMLTLLILGPKSPGKDIDTINDFPARSILSGWSGQGYKACPKCNEDTPSMHVAKPIIELCSFFKQICSQTLMEDDMLKDQSKVVDIMCNLELIYPPSFFDIMIHLVIYLPLEALEDGPIRPRRDERRTTQNSGICSLGDKDGEMYYGQLEEILEFSYMSFKVVLFRVKWFETSNEGQDDYDVIHFDNSSDLTLSTSMNDLDFATLHIDGQSMDVDAPPDIIDVDEDNDIIDDEDALPRDLADSDDEDLVNVDDDDVAISADVARGHDGNGGGDDRPPPHHIGGCCRGKGTRKPNLGGRKAGRLNTCKETRNLGLRKITNQFGPQAIRFEWSNRDTLMPFGDHAAHRGNLLGEIVREFPMHFSSWHNILKEQKAGVL
ncbi:hypothetical protein Tco_0006869 [Tanacetum coccineum]